MNTLNYDSLKTINSQSITLPHKHKRVVLFNFALFHEAVEINFFDEYKGPRVNTNYLFGKQLGY